jgi:hypothetical protein
MIGYVYKIYNDINELCYVGSTTKPIEKRWRMHLVSYKSFKKGLGLKNYIYDLFDNVGVDNCKYEVLDQVEYTTDKNILRKIERLWIEILPNAVNKYKPFVYDAEMLTYYKDWKSRNPLYHKIWKEQHKDYFQEYRKKNVTITECSCGSIITSLNHNMVNHNKSKKHIEYINSLKVSQD